MTDKNLKAILKNELERLNQELKEAAAVYNQNRRKIRNRIKYERLGAQLMELNILKILFEEKEKNNDRI